MQCVTPLAAPVAVRPSTFVRTFSISSLPHIRWSYAGRAAPFFLPTGSTYFPPKKCQTPPKESKIISTGCWSFKCAMLPRLSPRPRASTYALPYIMYIDRLVLHYALLAHRRESLLGRPPRLFTSTKAIVGTPNRFLRHGE